MTQREKAEELKSAITQLYSKEGRSISYIAKLIEIDRAFLSKMIHEWELPDPPSITYMKPSTEKFLNKHREYIKSRLDKDVDTTVIAANLGVDKDFICRTIIANDPVLKKANADKNERMNRKLAFNKIDLVESSRLNYITPDEEVDPDEHWNFILGYSDYEVSNKGRVRSYSKSYDLYYLLIQHQSPNNGRLYVDLISDNGVHRNLQVARLVGFSFVSGNDKEHNTINHKNGDVTDNRAENLEWINTSENNLHGYRELNMTKVTSSVRRYKFDRIIYKNKYEFKTVGAFARFIGKSETQARRYLDEPKKHDIQLIIDCND